MKYLFGFLLGLVLGAVCAAALIYFNPLIAGGATPAAATSTSLDYALSGDRLVTSSHNRWSRVPIRPADVQQLWEGGLNGSWLQSFVLSGQNGAAAAVATRLLVPSSASNGVTAGLLTEDYWLITFPGSGTLVAEGRSNVWPVLRDTLLRVDLLGRAWAGRTEYSLLTGAAAEVTGVAGAFSGRSGVLTEAVALEDYPRTGFGGLSGRIGITFDSAE
jgi:hypothetical protein